MRLQVLGYTASGKRNIKPGFEFDYLFPAADNFTKTVSKQADVYLTVQTMASVSQKYKYQTEKLAKYLQSISPTKKDLCKNIWKFIYDHIQYEGDDDNEIHPTEKVRTPARLWADRAGDCDCYALTISTILQNLKIKHYACVVKMYGRTNYQHVYIIVPKNPATFNPDRDKNNPSTFYAIDPVIDQPLEEPKNVTYRFLKDFTEREYTRGYNTIGSADRHYDFGKEFLGFGQSARTLAGVCKTPEQTAKTYIAITNDLFERVKIHLLNTIQRLEERNFDGKEYAISTLKEFADNIHDPVKRKEIHDRIQADLESPENLGNIFKKGFNWAVGVVKGFLNEVESLLNKTKDLIVKGAKWLGEQVAAIADFILSLSPISALVRKAVLKLIRNNTGRISEKLRWAFATNYQLEIASLPPKAREESQARMNRVMKAWDKVKPRGGDLDEHRAELVSAILTAAPLPEEVLTEKNYAMGVVGTNFPIDANRNYTFYELAEEGHIRFAINRVLGSLYGYDPWYEGDSWNFLSGEYPNKANKKKDTDFAMKKIAGIFPISNAGTFIGLERNDGYVFVYWLDLKKKSLKYFKSITKGQAFSNSQITKAALYMAAGGICGYKANEQDALDMEKQIAQGHIDWNNAVYNTNFMVEGANDHAIAEVAMDANMQRYWDNAIDPDINDKSFFCLPRNDGWDQKTGKPKADGGGWAMIYRMNKKPEDFKNMYDKAVYPDVTFDWNSPKTGTNPDHPEMNDVNRNFQRTKAPRFEYFKQISMKDFMAYLNSGKIEITPNGAFYYIASSKEVFEHLRFRYQYTIPPLPDTPASVGPSKTDYGSSGGQSSTSTSSPIVITTTPSNTIGPITPTNGGNIQTVPYSGQSSVFTFGGLNGTQSRTRNPHPYNAGVAGLYTPAYVRAACGCNNNKKGLGVVDPVTISVIAQTGMGILKNLQEQCKAKNPDFVPPVGQKDEVTEEEGFMASGFILEKMDLLFSKNPGFAEELKKSNPSTSGSSLQLEDVGEELGKIYDPNNYKTSESIDKKINDIQNKYNIGIGDVMQYMNLITDNQQNAYDGAENKQDISNLEGLESYSGKSLLAKIFTWLRDMWHQVFPPHTWLGKFGTMVLGGLAVITDKVWDVVKKAFGCNSRALAPETPPEEKSYIGLIVGGAAALAAGFFLLRPVNNNKALPPDPKSGLKGVEEKPQNTKINQYRPNKNLTKVINYGI